MLAMTIDLPKVALFLAHCFIKQLPIKAVARNKLQGKFLGARA